MAQFTERMNREAYPAIALRGLVVFPGIDTSFDVARPSSVKAVEMALQANKTLYLVAQKSIGDENPDADALYTVGVVAKIRQSLRLPDKSYRIVVSGISRAETVNMYRLENGAFTAEVITKEIKAEKDFVSEAYIRSALDLFDEYCRDSSRVSDELPATVRTIEDPGFFADFVAANILRKVSEKQTVLEIFDPIERIEELEVILENEIKIAKLEKNIDRKVQSRMDRQQREYYLREQLKVIKGELSGAKMPDEEDVSEEDAFPDEHDELEDKIKASLAPDDVKEKLLDQCSKMMSMPFGSSEAALIRNYIETCLEIPFGVYSEETIDLKKAKKILDRDHEGLVKVKERILEYLAAKKLGGTMKGQILCLVGAPGVGKTSIVSSVAESMGRKYVRISLGGVRDEADIRGHRKTYIGSMPGRIITALSQAGAMNPVITLDEIDKITSDSHGDPASALLEALDSSENRAFRDHFVELPVDLSRCLFVATANETDTIPPALLDRMEVIRINGYTENEKIQIAKKHLLPRQIKEHGLLPEDLSVNDAAITEIIRGYTREQGVRNLERELSRIARRAAKNKVDGAEKTEVTPKNVRDLLGKIKFLPEDKPEKGEIGVVNGLAWTLSGGEMLKIEALAVPGTGKLELTGSLGDVMKESAKLAVTLVRDRADSLGIENRDFYKNTDIHIHLPEGAVPKDGPSAGVTLVSCLASLFTGKCAKGDVAMTGEITLHGKVLPIGGLREKVNAAKRAGMKTVLIPEKNVPDLDEVDEKARKAIKFIPVKTVDEVLSVILEK